MEKKQIVGLDNVKFTSGKSMIQMGSADGMHYAVVQQNSGTADTISLTLKSYDKDQLIYKINIEDWVNNSIFLVVMNGGDIERTCF